MTHNNQPVALITGAASGLGLDLARQLAGKYELVLVDINLASLQSQCLSLPNSHCFGCDLASVEDVNRLTIMLSVQFPRIDLLINNAGITHRSLARITRPDVIEKVMAVNFFAPMRLVNGLMASLEAGKGKVVNISSMAGWMPVMARAGYCASKSALHQYFETFRAEMKAVGISVLMVYPSFLDTPIDKNALNGDGGKINHARSMVGKMRSSEWMAEHIVVAIHKQQERLFPDRFTHFSSLLYQLMPRLFMYLMGRKFASELEVN
ncbi:SDR family NAD(P)-dependent oxidoreductase [Pseudoalteromonas mariniglutinosa]|uniref:SDR family NAD(P)-dependent oxidoreductase n=1 Tax=Pseudoalteromonas mariniglutinosa TaxID=206042 RepID=UPI00384A84F5